MKHFAQVSAPAHRKENYLLITTEGEEFEPFSATMRNMARQLYAESTIEQYAGHIARFIDYIYEASEHLPDATADSILDAVYSYRSFLMFGSNSDDKLARTIATELRPGRITNGSSLVPIGAAIKYFLTLSDVRSITEKQETLFDKISLPKRRNLNQHEKAAIKKSSMLAGVIRGGVQLINDSEGIFGRSSRTSGDEAEYTREPMPFDKVGELIANANSYRDKAFYSLIAASGCRQHEGLQVHLSDIDFEKRTVALKTPFKREIFDLTESEYKKLAWKGRATERTFLIEPFKSAFFVHVEQYIRHERIAHGKNDYLFQKRGGRPLFTATRQSRSETFRKLRDRIGLEGKKEITGHSIRHTYGTYALNYLPLPDRFGLPMPVVRLLMGHTSIKSTEVYAKQDEDRALSQIEYANQLVYGLEGSLSLDEIKIRYHQSEIDKIMNLERAALEYRDSDND